MGDQWVAEQTDGHCGVETGHSLAIGGVGPEPYTVFCGKYRKRPPAR